MPSFPDSLEQSVFRSRTGKRVQRQPPFRGRTHAFLPSQPDPRCRCFSGMLLAVAARHPQGRRSVGRDLLHVWGGCGLVPALLEGGLGGCVFPGRGGNSSPRSERRRSAHMVGSSQTAVHSALLVQASRFLGPPRYQEHIVWPPYTPIFVWHGI